MRKCFALFTTLALFASPFFFAYLEAERLLGWPEAVYRWFDSWLPLVMIIAASLIAVPLPWVVGLFSDADQNGPFEPDH